MISGCSDDQTSADIGAGQLGNKKSAGAMTMAFRTAMSKSASMSYKQLLADMRKFLNANGFDQVPQLSSEHFLNLTESFMPQPRPPTVPLSLTLRQGACRGVSIGINYLSLPHGQ